MCTGLELRPRRAVKAPCFDLLRVGAIGLTLTLRFAMLPAAAAFGFYLAHPDARYFASGRVGEDQLADFAGRSGVPLAQARLAPNLG